MVLSNLNAEKSEEEKNRESIRNSDNGLLQSTFIAFGLFGELGNVDEVIAFLGGGHGGSATFSLLSLSRSRNLCVLCCECLQVDERRV